MPIADSGIQSGRHYTSATPSFDRRLTRHNQGTLSRSGIEINGKKVDDDDTVTMKWSL